MHTSDSLPSKSNSLRLGASRSETSYRKNYIDRIAEDEDVLESMKLSLQNIYSGHVSVFH